MSTALVTGRHDEFRDVAAALGSEGFQTIVLEEPVGSRIARIPRGSVDCYVQLPAGTGFPSADAPGAGPRPRFAQSLLARVDSMARVIPLLAGDASVVIVAEGQGEFQQGSHQHLSQALRLLAEAAALEQGRSSVRVAVLDGSQSPGEIALATRRWDAVAGRQPSLADLAPELGYSDWRDEVLRLTSVSDSTYLGWTTAGGRPVVTALRGTVVSPLRPVGPVPGPGFSWGHPGPGARALAQALLADVIGNDAHCPACPGDPSQVCAWCGGTFLSEWAAGLVTPFLGQVVSRLPDEEFELPAGEVAAWINRLWIPPAVVVAPAAVGAGTPAC